MLTNEEVRPVKEMLQLVIFSSILYHMLHNLYFAQIPTTLSGPPSPPPQKTHTKKKPKKD